jgi:hypothetical protein
MAMPWSNLQRNSYLASSDSAISQELSASEARVGRPLSPTSFQKITPQRCASEQTI